MSDKHTKITCPGACRIRAALLAVTLGLVCAPALAVKVQSLQAISDTVTRFVMENYRDLGEISEVRVTSLDPRLNLPACTAPLRAFPSNNQRRLGNATIGVRCEGQRPWTLYVPVKIVSEVTVLAAARPLPRGAVLKIDDLAPIKRDASRLPHGYFTDAQQLIGMRLKRSLRAGEPLIPSAVVAPPLIERGQEVLLSAESGGVAVSMKGVALQDGQRGQRIQVRNLSSNRVLEAEVVDRNRVRVPL